MTTKSTLHNLLTDEEVRRVFDGRVVGTQLDRSAIKDFARLRSSTSNVGSVA